MEPSAAEMLCDDPFDSIDDLLNFPNDDDVLAVVEACGDGGAPLSLPQAMSSAGSGGGVNAGGLHDDPPAAISGGFKQDNDALGLCNDIDIGNLEWLSNFFEDSELINFDFPATPAAGDSSKIPNNRDDDSLFRSSSPISVLEPNSLSVGTTATIGSGSGAYSSSSSCSSSSNSIRDRSNSTGPPPAPIDMPIVPARARTKRPRRPSFSARSFVPPEYPAVISYPVRPAQLESVAESYGPVLAMKKKKKRAVVFQVSGEENWVEGAAAPPVMRKCTHCEIQRTPQWRAGPMGPKTLCNACGVRYKSGRLFPEYRPAASPTFVPSFHSNSHKKVVEMRLNSNQTAAGNDGMLPQEGTVAAKNCDLLKYLRTEIIEELIYN